MKHADFFVLLLDTVDSRGGGDFRHDAVHHGISAGERHHAVLRGECASESGGFAGYGHHFARHHVCGRYRASAVSSGTLEFQSGNLPVPAVVNPVSILEFHGTADTQITPCDRVVNWNSVNRPKASVDDTFNYWTSQNSCQGFTSTAPLCSGFTSNDATSG